MTPNEINKAQRQMMIGRLQSTVNEADGSIKKGELDDTAADYGAQGVKMSGSKATVSFDSPNEAKAFFEVLDGDANKYDVSWRYPEEVVYVNNVK